MIIDYIGQELIWNLSATHPYQQNRRNYRIRIRCRSLKENEKIERFLGTHLDNHFTDTEKWVDENDVEQLIVTRITTFNALGGEGEVIFINEFAMETREEEI